MKITDKRMAVAGRIIGCEVVTLSPDERTLLTRAADLLAVLRERLQDEGEARGDTADEMDTRHPDVAAASAWVSEVAMRARDGFALPPVGR